MLVRLHAQQFGESAAVSRAMLQLGGLMRELADSIAGAERASITSDMLEEAGVFEVVEQANARGVGRISDAWPEGFE